MNKKLYNKLIDTQEPIYNCLNFLAKIDYYIGLTKLLDNNYSYAKYSKKQNKPLINIKNCWHPCLINPTKNSINTKIFVFFIIVIHVVECYPMKNVKEMNKLE